MRRVNITMVRAAFTEGGMFGYVAATSGAWISPESHASGQATFAARGSDRTRSEQIESNEMRVIFCSFQCFRKE